MKAAVIDAAQARPLTWKAVVMRALAVAVAGGRLPGATQAHRGAGSLVAAVNAERGLVHGLPGCRAGVFHLQLALCGWRCTKGWFLVVTAGLA